MVFVCENGENNCEPGFFSKKIVIFGEKTQFFKKMLAFYFSFIILPLDADVNYFMKARDDGLII